MIFPPFIFSDFDGTLTEKGDITKNFFEVLEFCYKKGIHFVIVSGRPAGWGAFLLSHYSLEYCLMEGGSVFLWKTSRQGGIKTKVLVEEEKVLSLFQERLREYRKKYDLKESEDNPYRLVDWACEIPKDPNLLKLLLEEAKKEKYLAVTRSNVHLNFCVPNITKYEGIKEFLKEISPETPATSCLFFGDSLNDVSVFASEMPSIGVSNCRGILSECPKKENWPSYVLIGQEREEINGVLDVLRGKNFPIFGNGSFFKK